VRRGEDCDTLTAVTTQSDQPRPILVTGSAGHLGEALMRRLRADGRPCRGLDVLPSEFTDVVASIGDRAQVRMVLAGVRAVLHTATLHKPHVATHSRQDFIDVNVTGTLNLLEASVEAGVEAFVFTSTTSTFGRALSPAPGQPAAWIDEQTLCLPKNIYGASKCAAEDLCELLHRDTGLPCLVLRTSRFFPEQDDLPARRDAYADGNLKANEFLYRRVELEDAVEAHLLALEGARAIGFERYIISAATPFSPEDAAALAEDAPAVVARLVPAYEQVYQRLGW
jgi:UDP-glucose 4-epimerase